MKQHDPGKAGETRRDFLKKTTAFMAGGHLFTPSGYAQDHGTKLSIVIDESDPTLKQPAVQWALKELRSSSADKSLSARIRPGLDQVPDGNEVILVARPGSRLARPILDRGGVSVSDAPESVGLVRGRAGDHSALLICGSDARGLIYGMLEVAEHVSHGGSPLESLRSVDTISESPANRIRSVTRYFESDLEDKSWYYDQSFWHAYLSMLMTQRFNRFSMAFGLGYNRPRDVHDAYFYFTYPFLFSVPGYSVHVPGLSDEERDRNFAMLRWLSEEVTARGLHFQVALWTHAYQWIDSPKANYVIEGLTPETHSGYCRDALQKLLEEVPAIKGITIRAHSESGIPEGSYDFWKALFEGFKRAGRRVEIDIHSKGIEHKLLRMALDTGNPVNVSPKYWAEHMGLPYHQTAIRAMERNPRRGERGRIETERRFTRYGYGDYLREDRQYGILYRIWPGTQRTLLWGDPAMAAGYGRYAHFCGSDGLELSEPLSFKGRMGSGIAGGRNAYADVSLRTRYDWEKHAYTYRVWGRLLYNPDASPNCWRRYMRTQFGQKAGHCERALAHASRILPLVTTAHDPSASNNSYWPEIYTNMAIVAEDKRPPYGDTPSPKRFGTVSSLDPALFSTIEEYADEVVHEKPSGRYSPLDVARWLEDEATAADEHLAEAGHAKAPAFRRLAVDVAAQSGLGRFFAQKLRAGVAYGLYERTMHPTVLQRAAKHYRLARDAWKKILKQTDGVYADDITYGLTPKLRGHWKDRLPAIEEDLAHMEKLLREPAVKSGSGSGSRVLPADVDLNALFAAAPVSRPRCEHLPAASFRRGKLLSIEMSLESGYDVSRVRLHYRHANQSELYEVKDMDVKGRRYKEVIPGRYTDSPYPLLYFFELHDRQGQAWIYPGFGGDLMRQPYFVVRQA